MQEYLVVLEYQSEDGKIVFFDKVCGFTTREDAQYHIDYLLSHQFKDKQPKLYIVKMQGGI